MTKQIMTSMGTSRTKLIDALRTCIEEAPEDKRQTLFDALDHFCTLRGQGNVLRLRKQHPLVNSLFDAIEEGLMDVAMQEKAAKEPSLKNKLTALGYVEC